MAERDQTDVSQPWDGDNQDWWDWYVSLADNTGSDDPLIDGPALPEVDLPDDEAVRAELQKPFELTDADRRFFRENGYIKLKNVLSPGTVLRMRLELVRLLSAEFGAPLDGGIVDRFISLEMVWLENPLVRAFVFSPRITRLSAELLGVPAIRLYHDNVLSKEPGCGRTPWHHDDHHFPLATHDVITVWTPAQAIPRTMGPLAFAKPLEVHELVNAVDFNTVDTSYDRKVTEVFRDHDVAVDDGPFDIGEVSFHHNLNFHAAAANRTRQSRVVLSNTYYADGARVVDHPTMVSGDWQKFIPDTRPGEVAASRYNPICWPPHETTHD